LIEKRGADVNKADSSKNSPLHYWAMTEYEFNDKLLWTDLQSTVLENQQNEISKHKWIGELLIKHGA